MTHKLGVQYKDGNFGATATDSGSDTVTRGVSDQYATSARLYESATSRDVGGQASGQEKAGAMLTAKAGVTSRAQAYGVGVASKAGVYASTGAQEHATGSIGSRGASVAAGASIGSSVGAKASTTVGSKTTNVGATVGTSVGDQLGAHFSGTLDENRHGVITAHVGGDLALVLGVKAGVTVHVDTAPIVHDADEISSGVSHDYDKAKDAISSIFG